MQIQEIIESLESLANPSLQESYDNVGLITGNPETQCTGIICSLDTTESVIEEAITRGCNLVVSHHPVIFSGLKKLNGQNYVERTVIRAIREGVAIYAIHTNLDNVSHGVNFKMAQLLGMINTSILQPLSLDTPHCGAGLIGELLHPLTEPEFLALLKKSFGLQVIRHTPLRGKSVRKIALCGGAGSFLLKKARNAGADFFVTGDLKYHEFFDAENTLVVADIGHYESEQFTTDLLADYLLEKFPTFAVFKTGLVTNPVQYYH